MSGEKGSDTSRLFHGVKEFRENDFEVHREIFKNLEKSQHPHTLFIGCSDSRVVPNLITGSLPGELFIIRNIAVLLSTSYAADEAPCVDLCCCRINI